MVTVKVAAYVPWRGFAGTVRVSGRFWEYVPTPNPEFALMTFTAEFSAPPVPTTLGPLTGSIACLPRR